MKKILAALVILIVGSSVAAGSAYALPISSLQIYNASDILNGDIYIGENFTVDVYVQGDAAWGDLASFGFSVDPLSSLSNFALLNYAIGIDYSDIGMGNYVAGAYWPLDPLATNAGDNVLLATLYFATLDVGLDTLTIEGLYDPLDPGDTFGLFYGSILSANQVNESISNFLEIEILDGVAIPEPATFFLVLLGLGVLTGFIRQDEVRK